MTAKRSPCVMQQMRGMLLLQGYALRTPKTSSRSLSCSLSERRSQESNALTRGMLAQLKMLCRPRLRRWPPLRIRPTCPLNNSCHIFVNLQHYIYARQQTKFHSLRTHNSFNCPLISFLSTSSNILTFPYSPS